jgi:hypothetical protein
MTSGSLRLISQKIGNLDSSSGLQVPKERTEPRDIPQQAFKVFILRNSFLINFQEYLSNIRKSSSPLAEESIWNERVVIMVVGRESLTTKVD